MAIITFSILLVFNFFFSHIHFPPKWTKLLVGIKAEPNYVPVVYQESYATIHSCGKRCDVLKLHYEGVNEQSVVTASNHVSWYDDPKWNKERLLPGTNYYYEDDNGKQQQLWWKDDKEELELKIEYIGINELPKNELVKMAESIKADGKKLY